MLSPDEINYLHKLPKEKADEIVSIKPFSPKLTDLANGLIDQIKTKFPDLSVRHLGASALGISGRGDLDIYALTAATKFSAYLPGMVELFGDPTSTNPTSIAWRLYREGVETEVYLTDPDSPAMQKQLLVFELLSSNPTLLTEYEKLKNSLHGSTYADYQHAKYEFYHQILDN